ncbi:hypothetical protein [Paludifilum halophilum]|uniref:VWFA domain-containing protein n=1 Tax=Paludifilum halophilum TaxID=1642702 RepID=A0A235B1L3_9BACL|nr:hypothetical protein [Paludifilum halophilum]OYD06132.1 hypothetical protein CHM34_17920 [Paludifilum halophilum]
MDQLPDELSGKEAYKHLIALLAEDYQLEVQQLNDFNTTFTLGGDTPDGADSAAGDESDDMKPIHISILLDASGSMAGKVDGGVKMDLAKAAVNRFASSLPDQAKVSLRVYGHQGSNAEGQKGIMSKHGRGLLAGYIQSTII